MFCQRTWMWRTQDCCNEKSKSMEGLLRNQNKGSGRIAMRPDFHFYSCVSLLDSPATFAVECASLFGNHEGTRDAWAQTASPFSPVTDGLCSGEASGDFRGGTAGHGELFPIIIRPRCEGPGRKARVRNFSCCIPSLGDFPQLGRILGSAGRTVDSRVVRPFPFCNDLPVLLTTSLRGE